jgi:hypothetical protein
VALDEPVPDQRGIWSGWMASPDTDYASPWDLILEGELADPMASMVQCWNSVLVYLKSTSLVIGQLSAERLATARALAAEHARAGARDLAPSEPGRRIERQVGGHAVLTGTPLAGEDADPRVRYQLLYHEAAEPLRICARDALGLIEEPVEPPDEAGVARWLRDAIAAIVDRLRERAAAEALAFEEVALVPTPASAEAADSVRCIELAHLLRISLYGRSTGDEAVLHARLTPLTREPVAVEVLHGGIVTASETLSDAQPILDVPLSGAGAVLLRIVEPLSVDMPLPEIAG